MQIKGLLISALASSVNAQQAGSLVSVLKGQPDLSSLASLLNTVPDLVNQLSGLNNITLLAPSNDAIAAFTNSPAAAEVAKDPQLLTAILTYHVLNGTYTDFTDTSFIHTALMPSTFTNLTAGQVVEATSNDGKTTFYSGLLMNSSVTSTSPLNFTGGIIHVLDRILTIPQNFSTTAVDFDLTGAVGAVIQADLVVQLNTLKDRTIFVPNNDAIQAIGSALQNVTKAQLKGILGYHSIEGQVLYSTDLKNDTKFKTSQGNDLTIYVENDAVFVNSARVVTPNVLIADGVLHVIDEVLNPSNTAATPNPSSTVPAFSGASSVSTVPFTSGVPTPTSSFWTNAPTLSSAASTSSSSSGGAWMPAATGAMGQAALFGGAAAVMLNF